MGAARDRQADASDILSEANRPRRTPLVIRGVMFDLDGTLLEIALEAFIRRYSTELASALSRVPGRTIDSERALGAVQDAMRCMMEPHNGTNQQAFSERFRVLTGEDLESAGFRTALDGFCADVVPALRNGAGPKAGGRQVVETAIGLGLKVVIATNPIFPLAVIEERTRWADVVDLGVAAITSWENTSATKPYPAYFFEACALAGLRPSECLMVGDDRSLDLPAADMGMRTYYVGSHAAATADWSGDLVALAGLLPRLI